MQCTSYMCTERVHCPGPQQRNSQRNPDKLEGWLDTDYPLLKPTAHLKTTLSKRPNLHQHINEKQIKRSHCKSL